MTDKEKIHKYLKFKGISKNKFYLKTGLSVGFLDSGSSLGVDKLRLIVDYYPDLNLTWIVSDTGDMIIDNYHASNIIMESHSQYGVGSHINFNTYIADVRASAGIGNIITNKSDLNYLPTMFIPNAPNGLNISFQITGDSMHPTIGHLDYVVANKLDSLEDLREGYVHVIIDADDGVVLKRVYKQGDDYKIFSDNPDYPPYTRSKYSIIAFFRAFLKLSSDFTPHNQDLKRDIDQLKEDVSIIKSKLLK